MHELNASGYMNNWGLFNICVSLLLLFQKRISDRAFLKATLGLMAIAFVKLFTGSNWFNYFHLNERNKHFWESTILVLNLDWILASPRSFFFNAVFQNIQSPPPQTFDFDISSKYVLRTALYTSYISSHRVVQQLSSQTVDQDFIQILLNHKLTR